MLCTLRCLPRLPWMASSFGSNFCPLVMAATTLRWPGMIQKNTLALMAVAIMAPTSRKAARPGKSWHAAQDAKAITASITTPTTISPWRRKPRVRHTRS